MIDYSALVAKWATLTGTTDQKLAAINALLVTVPPIKATVSPSQILNAVDADTFNALTPAKEHKLALILSGTVVDASIGTTIRQALQKLFSASPQTLANLDTLFAPFDAPQAPWWQTSVSQGGGGLTKPVSSTDLVAAGGLV